MCERILSRGILAAGGAAKSADTRVVGSARRGRGGLREGDCVSAVCDVWYE